MSGRERRRRWKGLRLRRRSRSGRRPSPSPGGSRKRRRTVASRARSSFRRTAPPASSTAHALTSPAPAPAMSPAASACGRARSTRRVGSAPAISLPETAALSSITTRVWRASPPSRTLSTLACGPSRPCATATPAAASTPSASAAQPRRLLARLTKTARITASATLRPARATLAVRRRQTLNQAPARASFLAALCFPCATAPSCASRHTVVPRFPSSSRVRATGPQRCHTASSRLVEATLPSPRSPPLFGGGLSEINLGLRRLRPDDATARSLPARRLCAWRDRPLAANGFDSRPEPRRPLP